MDATTHERVAVVGTRHERRGDESLVGVELGGTKIVCTLAASDCRIIASRRIATGRPEVTLALIEEVVDAWCLEHRVAALGIGSFGPLELDIRSPNYGCIGETTKPGWQGADIVRRLASRYGVPTSADTDVNGAALAEGRWGAAKGLEAWAYLTVGTGVGAGIVVNGRAVRGLGHPEAGHMLVRRQPGDEWPGACEFHGDCVEGLVSGPAIERRVGIPGERIPNDHPVWEPVADVLAAMIHNMIFTVVPERVLVGGGVPTKRPFLLPMIRERLADQLGGYGGSDAIVAAKDNFVAAPGLGDDAGPLGSVALALDALRSVD